MSRIVRSTDVRGALRARQRGFLLNPFRFGGGAATDPHFASVVLLCNYDTDLTDVKGHPMTAVGGASVSGGMLDLVTAGKYVTTPDSADWAFGSGDLTIELKAKTGAGWKTADGYFTALHQSSSGTLNNALYMYFESRTAGSNRAWTCKWFNSSNTQIVALEEAADAVNGYTEGAVEDICVERSGTTFRLYRGGVIKATATYSGALPDATSVLRIGSDDGTNSLKSLYDAIRITKGVARYNGAYTPPASFPTA